jgi:GntR family transcriptional regulator / MocR family aminotransferase
MSKRSHAPFLAFPLRGIERGGLGAAIYHACAAAIADGRLAAGARLPSSRQLARDWKVARNTIDDALAQLQAAGLVVRRVGSGSFVAPGIAARPSGASRRRAPAMLGRRALAAASGRGMVAARSYSARSVPRPQAFVAGLPALDAFPLDTWRRLAARRQRASGAALLGYLPASGYPPLQAAIADHLVVARGIDCDAGRVMVVNSTMQALDLIARVLLERGDCAWIEDPGYPNLRAVLAMAGARLVGVPVDPHGIDVARASDAAHRPALICVTPSCQYPTGAVLSLARRMDVLRLAAASGAWIVEDDHQHEFTWSGRPGAPIAALDRDQRTLYIGTFSDTVFPSLRLAYVVLPDALVDMFHAVRRQLDDHTHGFMQAVLADFIAGGHFGAHVRRMRALYAERRDALARALARHLPHWPVEGLACGLNASLQLPARIRDAEAAARAARRGVRVLPLSRYADAVSVNGLLLGYAALSERRIADGVARLAASLN